VRKSQNRAIYGYYNMVCFWFGSSVLFVNVVRQCWFGSSSVRQCCLLMLFVNVVR